MLHILWLILKWILILLGILIGLVLLLLLLILFCPVRYRASAEKKRTEGIREIRASGEVRMENSNKNMCFWSSTIQIETKTFRKEEKNKN